MREQIICEQCGEPCDTWQRQESETSEHFGNVKSDIVVYEFSTCCSSSVQRLVLRDDEAILSTQKPKPLLIKMSELVTIHKS